MESQCERRELQAAEHLHTALLADGSVDSGSAAATCVGVSGGVSGVSRWQWRELQAAEHLHTALVADGSVDSGSAAATCVGVSGGRRDPLRVLGVDGGRSGVSLCASRIGMAILGA